MLCYSEKQYKAPSQDQTPPSLRLLCASSGSLRAQLSESALPRVSVPPGDAVPIVLLARSLSFASAPQDTMGDALRSPLLPHARQQVGLCTSAFQKQKVRGHTWRCCEGHHPIVGKSTSFKLHPLLPSLHFHLPLLKEKERELQLKGTTGLEAQDQTGAPTASLP